MTREEVITKAAQDFELNEFNGGDPQDIFALGAKWADEHPASKYNLSDPDYVKSMIDDALNKVLELGKDNNLGENINPITLNLKLALKTIDEVGKSPWNKICKESLPPQGSMFWVIDVAEFPWRVKLQYRYNMDVEAFLHKYRDVLRFTHWMSFPTPPEEDNK